MTALTDGILGLLSFVLAIRLWKQRDGQTSRMFWSLVLFACTSAAWNGAIFHGLAGSMSPAMLAVFWKLVVWSVGAVAFCIIAGSAAATLPRRAAQVVTVLAGIQFLFYVIWMMTHDDFKYVVNNYAPALIIAAVLHAIAYRRNPAAAKLIWAAIFVSVVAAGVQGSTLDLHRHFNHNDLYHVIQMLGQYLFYRGAVILIDAERSTLREGLAASAT